MSEIMEQRHDIGKELTTLDFANLIGGPLNAVVEAQGKSAMTTANFIKEVAFDKNGNARNVEFKYTRTDTDGKTREKTLTVPFLTMLPIPYIEVKSASIVFNAKITSTVSDKFTSGLTTDTDANVNAGFWFTRAKVNTKTSYQKTNSSEGREERTFDLRIQVEAGSAEMPAGTERLLTLLEQSIDETKGTVVYLAEIISINSKEATLANNLPAEVTTNSKFVLEANAVDSSGNALGRCRFTATYTAAIDSTPAKLTIDIDSDVKPNQSSGAVIDPNTKTVTLKPTV